MNLRFTPEAMKMYDSTSGFDMGSEGCFSALGPQIPLKKQPSFMSARMRL